jgi:hypothetical protein
MDFPVYVDTKNIEIFLDEKNDLRYFLNIPILFEEVVTPKQVLVILKNPSKAKVDKEKNIYTSDPTVNRVISYFHKCKFTKVVIVNLFAKYFTDSNRLNDYVDEPIKIIGEDNDKHIKDFIQSNEFERIVVGWGGFPEGSDKKMKNLYLERIMKIENMIKEKNVFYVEKMDKKGLFPKHGMVWTIGAPMEKYNNVY